MTVGVFELRRMCRPELKCTLAGVASLHHLLCRCLWSASTVCSCAWAGAYANRGSHPGFDPSLNCYQHSLRLFPTLAQRSQPYHRAVMLLHEVWVGAKAGHIALRE